MKIENQRNFQETKSSLLKGWYHKSTKVRRLTIVYFVLSNEFSYTNCWFLIEIHPILLLKKSPDSNGRDSYTI